MIVDIIHLSEVKPEELKKYLLQNNLSYWLSNNLYSEIDDLETIYPNFKSWYIDKIVSSILNKSSEREIIIAFFEDEYKQYEIAGLAILKKEQQENKICTFRIKEDFRSKVSARGFTIAEELFEASFEYLNDRKPMITMSERIYPMFKKYITKYQFVKTQELTDFYAAGSTELVFNGTITN